jgi:type I pantothenate kinase
MPTACADLIDLIRERATAGPFLVGIAGPVAVGKTTIVHELARGLRSDGRSVRVISTDAFLLPNAVLNERGLLMRKGFPESYDALAIGEALRRLRSGETACVHVHSHDAYDIVADVTESIEPADVILIEGIVALQSPMIDWLDFAIYVDAAEACVREWFVERFERFTAAAADDAASFYHPFAQMPPEQVRQLAYSTWDGINAPNLHEHIAPSAMRADIILRKAADHSIAELRIAST